MKLSEICSKFKINFNGADFEVTALNSLKNASATELSYCDGEKNSKFINDSKAGAILVKSEFASLVSNSAVALVCDNPHLIFAYLSEHFAKPLFTSAPKQPQIAASAKIMPNVYLGSGVVVGEGSVVMAGAFLGDNVRVGKNCIIHPNAVIYNACIIGDGCHLNACCVIGSDGFGYAHTSRGEHIKIYHNGNVVLEDFVEIGACVTIDRGVFEPTIIKRGSKIDNLVQIGHNCELDQNCLLVAQTGLAGSTKLGRNVVMGGQSGTSGHLQIGDFAQIAARGGVTKDIAGGEKYAGHPVMKLGDYFKFQAKILRFFKKN